MKKFTQAEIDEATNIVTKKLIDEGKLVEAGWVILLNRAISPEATPQQLDAMRMAFFAGAQHVFASIMNMLDPGDEATPADEARMSKIDDELRGFIVELKARLERGKVERMN